MVIVLLFFFRLAEYVSVAGGHLVDQWFINLVIISYYESYIFKNHIRLATKFPLFVYLVIYCIF